MIYMLLFILAAVSLGMLAYALFSGSKGLLAVALVLCVLSAISVWLIWQAGRIIMLV